MKKMQCLFEREFFERGTFKLLETVSEGCEWVSAGEGTASRKWDGTAVMFDGVRWYQRYDAKNGVLPPSYCFSPCETVPDPITKHWPGWTPVNMGNESAYIREAISNYSLPWQVGTYEACGPKINSNAERLERHELRKHGDTLIECPRDFAGLRAFLQEHDMEGLVFSHPQHGRCKIRRADFGFPWGKHK